MRILIAILLVLVSAMPAHALGLGWRNPGVLRTQANTWTATQTFSGATNFSGTATFSGQAIFPFNQLSILASGGNGIVFRNNSQTNNFSYLDIPDLAGSAKTIQTVEHRAARMGVATLSSGSVVVSTTLVTANSRIFLTGQDNNATGNLRVSARSAGVSFTITSSDAGASGVVAYEIVEP